MIPKILHRYWDDGSWPSWVDVYWMRWKHLHRDWKMCTWSRRYIEDCFAMPPEFKQVDDPRHRADIARLMVLERQGGVYVDCDVEPVRALDPLLVHQMFVGEEDPGICCNAVIGAEPEHPVIRRLLAELPKVAHADLISDRTGPLLLSRFVYGRPDVTVLSTDAFYPYSYRDVDAVFPGEYAGGPDTYAIHHWETARAWSREAARRK